MGWINGSVSKEEYIDHNKMRSISGDVVRKTRYFGSIASLAIGGVLCYVSAHYVGAFVHDGKSVGLSASIREGGSIYELNAMVAKIVGPRKYKRIYLREGQSIEAEYVLEAGSTLNLHILQCKQAPIIEVFKCTKASERTLTVQNRKMGSNIISVAHSGLYYFSESVTTASDKKPTNGVDYAVHWKRI